MEFGEDGRLTTGSSSTRFARWLFPKILETRKSNSNQQQKTMTMKYLSLVALLLLSSRAFLVTAEAPDYVKATILGSEAGGGDDTGGSAPTNAAGNGGGREVEGKVESKDEVIEVVEETEQAVLVPPPEGVEEERVLVEEKTGEGQPVEAITVPEAAIPSVPGATDENGDTISNAKKKKTSGKKPNIGLKCKVKCKFLACYCWVHTTTIDYSVWNFFAWFLTPSYFDIYFHCNWSPFMQ